MSLSRMVTSDRKDFVQGVKQTIQHTSISSAVMTAASLYFNKKVKDIWYFSPPTNPGSTVEVVGNGDSASTDNKATSDKDNDVNAKSKNFISSMVQAVSDYAKKIGIGSFKNTKTVPKSKSSVLPEAYFIDMAISYGGQAVSAPIEEGSFTTYNKTNEPFKITATLAFDENKGKGILNKKSVTSIQDTLTKLVELKKSPIMFDIITPTREYKNVTLEKFDYKFDTRVGYGVVFVNAVFVEIPEIKVPQLRPIDVKQSKVGGLTKTDKGLQTGTIVDVDKVPQAAITYGEHYGITDVTILNKKIAIPERLQVDW